jgi:hypothetical protein
VLAFLRACDYAEAQRPTSGPSADPSA